MTGRIIIGGTDCTDAIQALVDAAPPLSAEQRDRLRLLLRPARRPGVEPAKRAEAA